MMAAEGLVDGEGFGDGSESYTFTTAPFATCVPASGTCFATMLGSGQFRFSAVPTSCMSRPAAFSLFVASSIVMHTTWRTATSCGPLDTVSVMVVPFVAFVCG